MLFSFNYRKYTLLTSLVEQICEEVIAMELINVELLIPYEVECIDSGLFRIGRLFLALRFALLFS